MLLLLKGIVPLLKLASAFLTVVYVLTVGDGQTRRILFVLVLVKSGLVSIPLPLVAGIVLGQYEHETELPREITILALSLSLLPLQTTSPIIEFPPIHKLLPLVDEAPLKTAVRLKRVPVRPNVVLFG